MRRRKKKSSFFSYLLASIIFLFIIAAGVVLFIFYPFPSNKLEAYFSSANPIIFQKKVFENEAEIINDVLYISFDFFKKEIDPTVHYDEKSNSMIITTKDKVVQIPQQELLGFINDEPFTFEVPVFITEDGKKMIHLQPLLTLYPLSTQYHEETGACFIYLDGDQLETGTVVGELSKHDARLRTKPTVSSPYTAEMTIGEKVVIEDKLEDYYFIRKENGIAGYILAEHIKKDEFPIVIETEYQEPAYSLPELNKPINLTWEAVYNKNPKVSELPNMPGVNVVSPTWFHIKNGEGDIANLASSEYRNWAHQKGMHIWALFSNSFDPDLTHEALSSFETRLKMIKQLLQYCTMYQLEGINIDFENVYLEDGALVTQFVRELTPYFHQAGLIVSMDVTFISSSEMWSKFYDRKALGEIVDYMMVMAYDEHWASSPQSGSVASLPWVETNLQNILEIVPNEKVILGIPLYTRIWKEQETEGGNIEVSSNSMSMNQATKWIQEHNLSPIYDESSGQNYVEYYDEQEKATYKIWLEDELSLRKRVDIMKKYQLAGIASWARSFANDAAWQTLNKVLFLEK